jgi:peptidoglycan/LPS O-acetylase OafA/YrhL
MMQGAAGRIKYLDGLRGIAIMLVVLSHYWGLGWTDILPFGDKFGSIRVVRQGWAGVELFFLISGFVILITIERCKTVVQFLYRRWLRLFPAMLVATVLTLVFNWTIQPVPQFASSPWFDALPGLTFIPASFYHMVFDVEIDSLHRSFWSLYTEVSFYILFGVSFFILGWKRATLVIALVGLIVLFGSQILIASGITGSALRIVEPFNWLGIKFFLWFASGILFAKARTLADDRIFALACVVGFAAAILISPNAMPLSWDDSYAMIAMLVLFAAAQRVGVVQNLLQWRPLLFLGTISYPLYLIHETVGLGLIVWTYRLAPQIPDVLLPVPTFVLMMALCYWITRTIEPRLKASLETLLDRPSPAVSASS